MLQQSWVLPVWLEGDVVIAGHLTEVLLQLFEELLVAFGLIQRHKGVDVGKLPPGDWLKKERTVRKVFSETLHVDHGESCHEGGFFRSPKHFHYNWR